MTETEKKRRRKCHHWQLAKRPAVDSRDDMNNVLAQPNVFAMIAGMIRMRTRIEPAK